MTKSTGEAQRRPLRIIIAGGGTGGHLYPGLALAQEYQNRHQAKIMFVGTSYGIENSVLPKTPFAFRKIWMRGLQRRMSLGNLLFPVRLLVSLIQCGFYIVMFKPSLILGTGGYVAGPVLMMGVILGVPTVIQEQNSYPGLVNRTLGKWVSQVHATYEASLPYFTGSKQVFVSGNPVRGDLNTGDREAGLRTFNLRNERQTLFVFGGSQGAQAINTTVSKALARLLELPNLQMLWVTGPSEFEKIKADCGAHPERVAIRPFIDDMASAYAIADIVLCRAGASTLSEIALCGIPSILVPYPFAAAGHQEFNARTMEKEGAALVLLQSSLNETTLVSAVQELLENSGKRSAMSQAVLKLARPTATEDIVTRTENLLS